MQKKKQTTLESLSKAMNKGFTAIGLQFKEMQGAIKELRDDNKEIHRNVSNLQNDMKELRDDMKEIRGDNKEIKGELKEMQGAIKELRGGLSLNAGMVKLTRQEMAKKEDVEELKTIMEKTYKMLDQETMFINEFRTENPITIKRIERIETKLGLPHHLSTDK